MAGATSGYKVLYAKTLDQLESSVLAEMQTGLMPLGTLLYQPQTTLFLQAVASSEASSGSETITASQISDATDVGKKLITAPDADTAAKDIGASTVGLEVFKAADADTGAKALGASTVGLAVFKAADADTGAKALGASTVGLEVFKAADADTGAKALGAGTTGLAVFKAADKATALTAIGALASDGTAAAADKLATARNIKATGGATGTVSFDGSQDAELKLTLSDPTATVPGGIVQIANVADPTDSTDTPTAVINLFAELRKAKIMAPS